MEYINGYIYLSTPETVYIDRRYQRRIESTVKLHQAMTGKHFLLKLGKICPIFLPYEHLAKLCIKLDASNLTTLHATQKEKNAQTLYLSLTCGFSSYC